MEIILLQRVENLGNLGDKVNVKPGYGRNFLIPGGKAQAATAANLAAFEVRRAELEKNAQEIMAVAEKRKAAFEGVKVTIAANAGEEGKLFGSIGPSDIADAIKAAGLDIEKKEIRMPEGPLREVGEFEVAIHLHTDINSTLTVVIIAE